jgi:hypothetical protein
METVPPADRVSHHDYIVTWNQVALSEWGVIVSAGFDGPGYDFVARFFVPQGGVP